MKEKKKNILVPLIFLITIFLLGCSAPPAERDVHDLIVQHYESRGHRVIELNIRDVGELPLGEREYMSTKGYHVNIRSITLRPGETNGERRVTFQDAKIEIHRSRSGDPPWIITDIKGIPVQ
jgi:hypothetical protein